MATKKSSTVSTQKKPTITQIRKENEELKKKLEKIENGAYCSCCGKFKRKSEFYLSTDPMRKSGVTPICKQCARDIAERVDENGESHKVTKDSLIKALRYLDKPFYELLYNTSIQECENLLSGRVKYSVFRAYMKNVAMGQYNTKTFKDSDLFKNTIIYEDEKDDNYLKNKNADAHSQYLKDKQDAIRLLGYDPFEKESIDDQPFLYSQLLGMLDSDENANDDMLRTSSIISIVRSFLQLSKVDNTISRLMSDYRHIENNAAAINTLQESKKKLQSVITSLAAESCISLKNSKNTKKGENTWTGKIKKLKELGLREAEVNGFDIETCKAMRQVMDLSNASILKQLKLDESEYSDMLAEQRERIVKLQKDLDRYQEISRILLRENLDLKDCITENELESDLNLINLSELYSCFSDKDGE